MRQKRVLIVDDSKDTVGFVRDALKALDPHLWITVVSSAEDALLEVIHHPADLLVVDVRLPGISGLELVKKIRASNRSTKIILMSGLTDPDLGDRSRQSGADAFLPKPMDLNELLSTVDGLLGLGKNLVAADRPATERNTEPVGKSPKPPAADQLGALRQRLGAETVLLVDVSGRILSQAGELPQTALMSAWVPAIVENLSASLKASQNLGLEDPENVLAFRGETFNVVASPLGKNHGLLVILTPSAANIRFAVAFEELLEVQKELRRGMGESAPAIRPPAAEPLVVNAKDEKTQPVPAASPSAPAGETTDDLEGLFKRGKPVLSGNQVDAFWDNLVEEKGMVAPTNPDTLTYEQAVRMGLTPKQPGT